MDSFEKLVVARHYINMLKGDLEVKDTKIAELTAELNLIKSRVNNPCVKLNKEEKVQLKNQTAKIKKLKQTNEQLIIKLVAKEKPSLLKRIVG